MVKHFTLFFIGGLIPMMSGVVMRASPSANRSVAAGSTGVVAVWFSTTDTLEPEAAWARLATDGHGRFLEDGALGFSDEMLWGLVEVCGPVDLDDELVLDIRNPHIDRLDAWFVKSDGRGLLRIASAGTALRPLDRSTPNRRPLVYLPTSAVCHQVLLCVNKRKAFMAIPLAVMTARELETFELRADLMHGGIFAVFFLMIVLGVVGFIFFRERCFVSYAVYAAIRWFYIFIASGYASMTLLAEHPEWTTPLRLVMLLPLMIAMLWYVNHHFELGRLNAYMRKQNIAIMLLASVGFVVALIGRLLDCMAVSVMLKGMYLLMGVCLLHLVVLIWVMRRVARRATRYFLWAFAGTLGAAGYVILEELGVMPFVDHAVPLALWAALVEVIVLLTGAVQLVMERLKERQALFMELEQVDLERMRAFVQGIEEERRRVARELHDNVGADLALISHQIQHPQHIVAALQKVSQSVRRISSTLNPMGIHGFPLDENLRQLVQSYYMIPVQMHLMLDPWPLVVPGQIEFECYRIVQEALQNALKHARASHIFISLHYNADEKSFGITIEDDGVGFELSEVSLGQGLKNMQYRADIIGARWSVVSTPGKGTFVSLEGIMETSTQ